MPNLFVYGTLMHGQPAHVLLQNQKFLGSAACHGELYNLGGAPGYRTSLANQVHGELYEIEPEILEYLDYFEGHPRLYKRITRAVRMGDRDVLAWVYEFQEQVHPSQRILSGDWRKRGR